MAHTSQPDAPDPMKPHILHLIESAGLYGAENVILTLARAQQKTGDFIPVIGCIVNHREDYSALYEKAISENILVIKLVLPVSRYLLKINNTAQLLREYPITLIHCHGYKPAVFGFFIAKCSQIPIISTCHNWIMPTQGPLKMRTMIALEKFLYRYFNKVIAVSRPIFTILSQLNIATEKLGIIYNGIEIKCNNESLLTRESLDLNNEDFVVINLARLSSVKNQRALIEAVATLVPQYSHIRLLLVGDGNDQATLKALVHEHRLEENIIFLGFRKDALALLGLSNCFCLSSIDEGMPISLLEAAAKKVPIISTNVGSVAMLIENNISGLLIPPNNIQALSQAILQLINNPELGQKFSTQAHQRLQKNFSAEKMQDQYAAIYRTVLSS